MRFIGKPFFGALKMFLVLENAEDRRAASGHCRRIRAATRGADL